MADTQEAPQVAVEGKEPGSLWEAQEALLKLAESEKESPETEEAQAAEVEESTEETQDESSEEESEERESEEIEEEPEESDPEILIYQGEEYNIEDLVKGNLRQSDYTRKTQTLAEQRKEISSNEQKMEAELSQIQAERQHYVQSLENFIQSSAPGMAEFEKVNWTELKETDPFEYMTKREEYREAKEKVQEAQQAQMITLQKQQEEQKQEYTKLVQNEHRKLVDKVPEWGDPSSQKSIASKLRGYALDQEFTAEELDALIDHRSLVVLRKAMLYDELKSSNPKGKKVKNKPRVVRAGTPQTKGDKRKGKRSVAMKRLQETGHVDDAASILEEMFGDVS